MFMFMFKSIIVKQTFMIWELQTLILEGKIYFDVMVYFIE